MNGIPTRHCQEDQQWSGVEPTCKSKIFQTYEVTIELITDQIRFTINLSEFSMLNFTIRFCYS